MKAVFNVLKWTTGIVVVVLAAGFLYFNVVLPDVPDAEPITVELTEERILKGAYLANHVVACMDCHAVRDWTLYSGPPVPGTLGAGGERYGSDMGLPAELVSANLTPFGLSTYSDGELFRLITTGVTHDNRVLFPLMPYTSYSRMDRDDVISVIAYLRSLPSIETDHPASSVDFPVNLLLKLDVPDYQEATRPDAADRVAYGQYLFDIASCADCHTNTLRGGMEFPMKNGTITRSANITPDSTTGIGSWTEQRFIDRFKTFNPEMKATLFNTPMPWAMYAGITEDDLSAIYAYLRTVRPITNAVERFTAP